MESKTKYYASLDILKTVVAVLTLFFHCNMHLGIHFGFFTPFISQGAIAMDLFFMLSGYALFVGYYAKELDAKSILTFYKRRLVSIYPLYALVMVAFWLIPSYRSPLRSVLISLPVELSLMQSWFSGMFAFLIMEERGFCPAWYFVTQFSRDCWLWQNEFPVLAGTFYCCCAGCFAR